MTINNIFTTAALPADHVTINAVRYYSVAQIAKHVGICNQVVHNHTNEGRLVFVTQPGLRNGKKLIAELDLVEFLKKI